MKHNLVLDAGIGLEKERLIACKKEKGVMIKHFLLEKKDEKPYRHNSGDYFTITFDSLVIYERTHILEKIFIKTFKNLLKKYHKGGPILVVGLGSASILGDSFGNRVLDKLIATNQYNDFLTIPKVALFAPQTTNKTGISSFRLIKMVVEYLKPDVIILIDSLATSNHKYLNRTLEINDCGVIFADQLRSNKKIDRTTFHVPVLSIGYTTLLKYQNSYLNQVSLEKDLNILCQVVSHAINKTIMS